MGSARSLPQAVSPAGSVTAMSVLIATHDLCWLHDPGPGHPERPDRLSAVKQGFLDSGVRDSIEWIEAGKADRAALEAVHPAAVLDELEERCRRAPLAIDPDTRVSVESARAAIRAAGAGLDLIAQLDNSRADVGWSLVRPPGHHALPTRQMGFCLINNIAVAARFLANRGERVAIVDIDAHHGNGTQEIFYGDPSVLFVSLHQHPWYPFTGELEEVGSGEGRGFTVNVPLPAGATGLAYRLAFDDVVLPVVSRFRPTWLLISAGFDGHRSDPLSQLELTSGDYADLVGQLLPMVAPARRLVFLEGGYDLAALVNCGAATMAVSADHVNRPESASTGGPGAEMVEAARRIHLDGGCGDL